MKASKSAQKRAGNYYYCYFGRSLGLTTYTKRTLKLERDCTKERTKLTKSS